MSTPTFNVTFLESGLPSGSTFSINFGQPATYKSVVVAGSANITFVGPNGTYSYYVGWISPGAYEASPQSGHVTVNGAAVSVSVAFASIYLVRILESGLANETVWSATVSGTGNKETGLVANSTVQFALPNGTYALTVGPVHGYASPGAPTSLSVAGKAQNISVQFQLRPGYFIITFTGGRSYPMGFPWWVDMSTYPSPGTAYNSESTRSADLPIAAVNGTYAFDVWDYAGASPSYTISPSNGTVTVNGASTSVNLTFAYEPTYSVEFVERGLPAGENFTVEIPGFYMFDNVTLTSSVTSGGASMNATDGFLLPNGTHPYVVDAAPNCAPSPGSGSFQLKGSSLLIWIHFCAGAYPVTFSPHGLPPGTSWAVTLGGTSNRSTLGATISFRVANGSYSFSVGSVAGYAALPAAGDVSVQGLPVSVDISFQKSGGGNPAYAVTFIETGLPSGSVWSVDLNGSTMSATTNAIGFVEPNGSYAYTATCGDNYSALPSSGYANISGAAQGRTIVCSDSQGLVPVRFSAQNLPSSQSWQVTLTGATTGLTIEVAVSASKSGTGGSTIAFAVSPGSYAYEASATGFKGSAGNVMVTPSSPQEVTVHFLPAQTSHSPNPTTLLLSNSYAGVGIGMVLVAALVLTFTIHHRRSEERMRGRLLVDELTQHQWTYGPNGLLILRDGPR